jgi:hypothetical protein
MFPFFFTVDEVRLILAGSQIKCVPPHKCITYVQRCLFTPSRRRDDLRMIRLSQITEEYQGTFPFWNRRGRFLLSYASNHKLLLDLAVLSL